jgi:hypothetical protein
MVPVQPKPEIHRLPPVMKPISAQDRTA